MPPSAHRSSYLLSGFLRGMQLVLAPLSCLLGEEPDEEQNPASLEQQNPNHQVGQPQSRLRSCQPVPKSASKVHTYRKTRGRYLREARLFWMPLHSLWSPQGVGSPRISSANGTLLWESLDFLMTLGKQPSPPPPSQHCLQAAVSVPLPGEPFSNRFHILQLPLVFTVANHLLHRPFLPWYSLPVWLTTLPHLHHQTCTLGGTMLHSADQIHLFSLKKKKSNN